MTVQELLRKLPELSSADLEKVRLRVQLLSSSGKSSTKPARDADDWLADGFCLELRRRGLLTSRPHSAIFPKAWAEKSTAVQEFLLKGFKKKLVTAEKLALAQLCASLLLDYLQRAGAPVGPKMLFANVDKVPQALEAAFPGYWASQVLHFCIRNRSVA